MLRILIAAMVATPLIACMVVIFAVGRGWLPKLASLAIALSAAVSESMMAVMFGVFAFTNEGPLVDAAYHRQILAIGVFGWMAGALFLGAGIFLIERYASEDGSHYAP